MSKNLSHLKLNIEGMVCTGCETIIENKLKKLEGIEQVKADYIRKVVAISFDNKLLQTQKIVHVIEKLDYKVVGNGETSIKKNLNKSNKVESVMQLLGIVIIIIALYMIIRNTNSFNFIPKVNQSMGYGVLFIVGLLTSFHCIAMCGGINISQCASYQTGESESKLRASILYNLGRVIAYTVIGGIVGGIGSIVSFSGTARGVVTLFAGAFMVIMGLNMLNVFPWLRRFNIRMPKFIGNKIRNEKSGRGPLYVGLLNGLMPCGPLQSMQLYALGTGSILTGALSMFYFSLGTVPLMFGLGALSSLITNKLSHKIMKASAILVITLGFVMLNRGFSLSGITLPALNANPSNAAVIKDGVQVVKMKMESGRYAPITLQKDIPVKWIIEADESDLNGCNNPVTIPKYNIQKSLVVGENIIEFTPKEEGTITYTCWMGMISSTISVVNDVNN